MTTPAGEGRVELTPQTCAMCQAKGIYWDTSLPVICSECIYRSHADLLASLRAVEAERDAARTRAVLLSAGWKKTNGLLDEAQAEARRLTAEVERLRAEVSEADEATARMLNLARDLRDEMEGLVEQAETRERALREAAEALERAEQAHANCPDCEGEGVPELCGTCFPLFDDARVKRRAALTPPAPRKQG